MNEVHRHFGTIRGGEEVIIAGYNKSTNACLVVRVNHLPQDEGADLRRIAMSSTAQNLDYLIPTLRVEMHKSGRDWFTHIAERLRHGGGAILNLPLKEIETMNEAQKAFFKGYGPAVEPKGGPSSRVGSQNEFTTPITTVNDEIVVAEPVVEQQPPANLQEAQQRGLAPASAPTPATDPEMARVVAQQSPAGAGQMDALASALTSLAESQAKQAEAMSVMAEKMKPAPRRTVRKKKATPKAPAQETPASA